MFLTNYANMVTIILQLVSNFIFIDIDSRKVFKFFSNLKKIIFRLLDFLYCYMFYHNLQVSLDDQVVVYFRDFCTHLMLIFNNSDMGSVGNF